MAKACILILAGDFSRAIAGKKKGQPGAPEAVPALPVRRDVNDLKIPVHCFWDIAK
jgi:hypothetical protein